MVINTKDIVNKIISHSWNGRVRIDKLIIQVIIENYDFEIVEDLTDKYADTGTKYFRQLIASINETNKNNDFIKIILDEGYDGYYIEQKHQDDLISKKYAEAIGVIDEIGSPKRKNKGVLYEKFCKIFLNDLGINADLTKGSNDKGIDIIGSFNANLPDEVGKIVFNDDIYLLIQTKYYNKKIDTPVIRKLVGDSLFIRFDELEYSQIKHNAFHLIVFSHYGFTLPAVKFAEKNKIKLFDSTKIAHIISEKPQKKWKCLEIFKS